MEDKDKSSYSRKITISDIKKMNIDEVYEWIKKDVGIDEEEAIKLKNQEINGSTLLTLTEENLKEVFNLIGPPEKIRNILHEIKNSLGM